MKSHIIAFSESDLAKQVRFLMQSSNRTLIGIDGVNGTGKSSLARRLGASLDCDVIECDRYIRNDGAYPFLLDIDCLQGAVSAAISKNRPVIVESVMLQLVFDALRLSNVLNIYVKHSWPKGVFTHQELFDSTQSEDELLAAEDEICRAAGIPDDAPILARQFIRYHKRFSPHERADVVFEACFST